MNVASLSKYFQNFREFIAESGGTRPVLEGLDSVVRGLQPFAGMEIREFSNFLVKAEVHERTGVYPGRSSPKPGAKTAPPKPGVEEFARKVVALHESAAHPDTTPDMIAEGLRPLDTLTKADLLKIAAALNISSGLSPKTKPFIVATIKNAVQGVWDTSHRVRL